jgi:hypothetical protein
MCQQPNGLGKVVVEGRRRLERSYLKSLAFFVDKRHMRMFVLSIKQFPVSRFLKMGAAWRVLAMQIKTNLSKRGSFETQ